MNDKLKNVNKILKDIDEIFKVLDHLDNKELKENDLKKITKKSEYLKKELEKNCKNLDIKK
tara:strand:- start:429 stop:611 length:183 start_codon:yes stop_codon:yes gene_type:complete